MAAHTLIENREAKIAISHVVTDGSGPVLFTECSVETALSAALPFSFTRMDLRGQGQSLISERAVKELELDHFMSDFDAAVGPIKKSVAPTRGKGNGEQVAFIGYSQSAFFMTHYAALHPQAVSKLVLIEPALYTEREELLKRAEIAERGDGHGAIAAMLRYVDPSTGLDAERKASEVQNITSLLQSPELIANVFRLRANNPITSRHTRKLRMPVLLIAGTNSHVKDMVARAATEIEDASVWYVPGATHLDIMGEKYAKSLATVIKTFLDS